MIFTGSLDETKMCEQYLKSNIFICCSSIENSPNSLGEAQLLRMPYLTSYVGGTPDIASSTPETLYRYEETEMLAAKICDIFAKGEHIIPQTAELTRYDADTNLRTLVSIYHHIGYGKNR